MRRFTIMVVAAAVALGAMLPAAEARPKTLRARVHALEKSNRALKVRVSQDEDALGLSLMLLSCFQVLGTDSTTISMPDGLGGMLDFPGFLTLSPSIDAPAYWTAVVDPSCVDTSGAASARSRAFRTYFGRR